MFLKGPEVTHPPPVPAGKYTFGYDPRDRVRGPRPGMYSPLPDILVALPSKIGPEVGSEEYSPQFQYLRRLAKPILEDLPGFLRLCPSIATFIPEGLFIIPCEVPMPREKCPLEGVGNKLNEVLVLVPGKFCLRGITHSIVNV